MAAQQRNAERRVDERRQRRGEGETAEPHHTHEREAQAQVGEHRDDAQRHRHPAATERIEHRRRNACRRVADEPDGIQAQRRGGGGGVAGREVPTFEQQADDLGGEGDEAAGGRDVHHQHQRQSLRNGASHGVAVVPRSVTGGRRQHRRRDRDPEEAKRQVHHAKRILQPRHRAGALAGGEQRADEQVYLGGGEADGAWPHQRQHLAQPAVAQIEHRSIAEPLTAQRRPLHEHLRQPADQRRYRHRHDARQSEHRHHRCQRHREHDRHHVEGGR